MNSELLRCEDRFTMSWLLEEWSLLPRCYGRGSKSESTLGLRISSVENRLGVRKSSIVKSMLSAWFLPNVGLDALRIEEGLAGCKTTIFEGINETVFEGNTANVVVVV